jgi:hypothetical protein
MIAFDRISMGGRLASATLFGTLLVAAPTGAMATGARPAAIKQGMHDDVEARIKTLHGQLKITPEQEQAWNAVAEQMRANAKARAAIRDQQGQTEKTATAPDMINAYAKTMDAHADGVHKFADAFQSLYDGMSPQQKKTADSVFREKVHRAAERHKS